jgi:hypothetical protein
MTYQFSSSDVEHAHARNVSSFAIALSRGADLEREHQAVAANRVLARIASGTGAFFNRFLAALHESRRLRAERELKNYRHIAVYDPATGAYKYSGPTRRR